jgi:Flp pilus assembly pilin Flp
LCELRTGAGQAARFMVKELDMSWIRRFTKDADGQDLIEYGLLASLIAVFAMGAVKLMGDTVANVLWGSIASSF